MGKRIEQKRNHAMLFIHSVLQHKKMCKTWFFCAHIRKAFQKETFFQ